MSIESVRSVLEHSKSKGSERLMLLVIAEHADKNGIAWPGNTLLAKEANISERQAQRLIQSLAESGELEIVNPGDGRGNKRVLRVSVKGDKIDIKGDIGVTLSDEQRVTNPTLKGDISGVKGDKSDIKGDIAMSPEPLNRKNQNESLPTPKPEPSDRDGRWLLQKLEGKGFMYLDAMPVVAAMKLEQDYTDEQLLQAIEKTHEMHLKKISNGERGITVPMAYMKTVLMGGQPVAVNGNGHGNAGPVRQTQSARNRMPRLN